VISQVQSLSTQSIPDRYIVSLKRELGSFDVSRHYSWVDDVHKRSVTRRDLVGVEKSFQIGAFNGYVGEFDSDTVEQIRNREDASHTSMAMNASPDKSLGP
jgi:oryzin